MSYVRTESEDNLAIAMSQVFLANAEARECGRTREAKALGRSVDLLHLYKPTHLHLHQC